MADKRQTARATGGKVEDPSPDERQRCETLQSDCSALADR